MSSAGDRDLASTQNLMRKGPLLLVCVTTALPGWPTGGLEVNGQHFFAFCDKRGDLSDK